MSSAPSDSPPLATERSARAGAPGGCATPRIIFSAVGGRKVCVTPWRAISSRALTPSNFSKRRASTGTPWCQAGSKTSSNPPIQAQSAGVHISAAFSGKNSCDISTPGRWPSSTRCACSAPLGLPVVPEV
ncbi:hypothetical protein D9M68_861120 [compost metagenome]